MVAEPEVLTLTGSVSDMRGGQRTEAAFQAIQRLHKASEPVRVITEWATYPEMVISRVDPQPSGRGMTFTMELSEILRVSSGTGPSTPSTALRGAAASRTGTVQRGRVPTVFYA